MKKNFFSYNHQNSLIAILISTLFVNITYSANQNHLRGSRYCEIILNQSLTHYAVYNTWGLNHCPEQIWKKITVERIKEETGSSRVHLNGPRYWVIDGYKNSTLIDSTIKHLGGLSMREAGVLHFSVFDLIKSHKPYQLKKVERHTTWVYLAGKPIYELIDAHGNVYVMQSFSIQTHHQTLTTLSHLGKQLSLPKGWHFKTGVLTKQAIVKAIDNLAVVVQDDYFNTYQQAPRDLLIP